MLFHAHPFSDFFFPTIHNFCKINYERELTTATFKFKKDYKESIHSSSKELEIKKLTFKNKSLSIIYITFFLTIFLLGTFFYLNKRQKWQKEHNKIIQNRSNELAAFNAELDMKNKELERFAFISSHDLKTPLVTMIGFTDLLREETKELDNQKFEEYSTYILVYLYIYIYYYIQIIKIFANGKTK